MQARVYISLQGFAFDPHDFHARVGGVVPGEVRHRKHSGAPLTNFPLDYWASPAAAVSPVAVGTTLCDVLARLGPFVGALPERAGLRVYANVVLEFDPGEEPVGLNFPAKVIELLRAIGAELDIDAVPRLT
jgi:hypothetical protein